MIDMFVLLPEDTGCIRCFFLILFVEVVTFYFLKNDKA